MKDTKFKTIQNLTVVIVVIVYVSNIFCQETLPSTKPALTKEEKRQAEKEAKAKKEAEKSQAKAEQKSAKEKAKAKEKENKDKLNSITVDVEQLLKFPQDYVNRALFVRRIILEDLTAFQDGTETVYFITTRTSESGFHNGFPSPGELTFVAPQILAKQLFDHMRDSDNPSKPHISANILLDVVSFTPPNNRPVYFGRIKCVQSVGFFSRIINQFGDCSF